MNPCVDYTHKGVSWIVKDEATLTWWITNESMWWLNTQGCKFNGEGWINPNLIPRVMEKIAPNN
jgi:hypothetical protein